VRDPCDRQRVPRCRHARAALFELRRKGGSVFGTSLDLRRWNAIREVRTVMRKATSCCSTIRSAALLACFSLLSIGCKKTDDPPPTQAGYPTPAPAAAPVQQAPGYGDGTTQQAAPVVGATPAAAPVGTLSQPGPFATPCQTDAPCLTHHCNIAAGKCAFPCQTDNDCMPGNRCIAPACLPKLQ
jgi:hypothetical protein